MRYLFLYALVFCIAACGNHAAEQTSVDKDHANVIDSPGNRPDSLDVKDTAGKVKAGDNQPNNH